VVYGKAIVAFHVRTQKHH